jgi:hypothetical protein
VSEKEEEGRGEAQKKRSFRKRKLNSQEGLQCHHTFVVLFVFSPLSPL